MRFVVDTNILISATFWLGSSSKVIREAENHKITIVISPQIIEEYAEVLCSKEIQAKIKKKNLEMKQTIQKIIEITEITDIKTKITHIKDDPDDDKILECAIDGKADYIVSKDKHLLNIGKFRGIKIITPEDALKIIDLAAN